MKILIFIYLYLKFHPSISFSLLFNPLKKKKTRNKTSYIILIPTTIDTDTRRVLQLLMWAQ